MNEALQPLLDQIKSDAPDDAFVTLTMAQARLIALATLPKPTQLYNPLQRQWTLWGGVWMWKPSARSKKVWHVAVLNDTPRDVRTRLGTWFGTSCRLEDFAYIADQGLFVSLPLNKRTLTARQINRLFPPETWPKLNGSGRLPSNFIRRHNRFGSLAELANAA